jgi:hypothetical protein
MSHHNKYYRKYHKKYHKNNFFVIQNILWFQDLSKVGDITKQESEVSIQAENDAIRAYKQENETDKRFLHI